MCVCVCMCVCLFVFMCVCVCVLKGWGGGRSLGGILILCTAEMIVLFSFLYEKEKHG